MSDKNVIVENFKQIGKVRHVLLTLPLASGEGDEIETRTYKVRGLSPKEEFTRQAIMESVEQPRPPMKKRLPQSVGGKLQADNLALEDYYDVNDATYLEEMAKYSEMQNVNSQRVFIYRLMVAVKGFDLSDDDIRDSLGQSAHPKEPLDKLLLRLDQIGEIILPESDQVHLGMLVRKIMELSGVSSEAINFT